MKKVSVNVEIPEETDRFYRKMAETRMVSKAAVLREAIVRAARAIANEDPEFKAVFESVLSTCPKRK